MFKKTRKGSGSQDTSEVGIQRSVTQTDYDLEYLEEIELEKAFNVFSKNI